MLNKIATILLLTGAVIASAVVVDRSLDEQLLLNGAVTPEFISPLVRELTNDGSIVSALKTTTITIHSPGGLVMQEELLSIVASLNTRKIITKVPKFAASAATDIFLLGNERLMHKDAELIFHEVRLMLPGDLVVTFSDLKSILEKGTLAPNSELIDHEPQPSRIDIILGVKAPSKKKDVIDIIKDHFGENLKKIVEELTVDHNQHIKRLSKVTGLTEAKVSEKLIIPNKDTTITLKEALELNIATGELK